jgi:hypothetical protein
MRMLIATAVLVAISFQANAQKDINDKGLQDAYKAQQQQKQKEQYQQYLRNNDAQNGISQRTGPTVTPSKDGGGVGYQWSTK